MRMCSLLRNAGTGIERDLERLVFTSAISANAVAQIDTIERVTVAVVKRQNPRATASLGPKQVVIEMGGFHSLEKSDVAGATPISEMVI